MPENDLPEAIGPYRPLKQIGFGAFGEVYLALDDEGRTVAIKVLHPFVLRDPGARVRLRREVEIMRRIRSARIAQVLDADLEAAAPYIVTHYVQGRSLEEIVHRRGPLDGDPLRRFAASLAKAVADIHAVGCIHRDLKPANVMMADGQPVVIDFGIAHEVGATRVTQRGITGTPGYMAPEVLTGGELGPAADVFAWAGTVAFAATGRHALDGPTPEAIHHRTRHGEPDLDGIPEPLHFLLANVMNTRPPDRPTAEHLVARLTALTGPAPPAPPDPRIERGTDGHRRLTGYRELRRLRDAGLARSVLARDDATGDEVTITYLTGSPSRQPLDRFRGQARLIGAVSSPYVPGLRAYVEDDQCAAMVTDPQDGDTLREVLRERGTLTPERALAALRGSLLGLAAVHQAGLVHCAYGTANVLVRRDGVSLLINPENATVSGASGSGGIPVSMAPEQWEQRPVSPATDLYGVSCVLFECVTGRVPFDSQESVRLMREHLTSPPPLELLPESLRGPLARGLAKRAGYRPQSVEAYLAELGTSL